MNVQHRTSNIERRIMMSLRSSNYSKTLPGSHAPAWEPIWYAFPRWSMGTKNQCPMRNKGSGFRVLSKMRISNKKYRIMKFFPSTFEIHYSLFLFSDFRPPTSDLRTLTADLRTLTYVSSSFPIQCSMLDVRCSMFIFSQSLPGKNNLALMPLNL